MASNTKTRERKARNEKRRDDFWVRFRSQRRDTNPNRSRFYHSPGSP